MAVAAEAVLGFGGGGDFAAAPAAVGKAVSDARSLAVFVLAQKVLIAHRRLMNFMATK
ncbi:MAG: hypothetical protein WKF30_00380 [Pyrinomonadaceae bacterium]